MILVQKVTFESISENWALVNQPLAPRKKAICDILHQWLMYPGFTTNTENTYVVREPLHCLAAQPREAPIFEGES